MLKVVALKNGKTVEDVEQNKLAEFANGKNFVWVDIENGTKDDFKFIEEAFNIHPLTIEDMKSHNTLPKMDILADRYLFIAFHKIYYNKNKKKIDTAEIDFCLSKNFIITVHVGVMEKIDDYRKRLIAGTALLRSGGPDSVLHNIMDIEVDMFTQLVDELDDQVERLEDKLIKGNTENALQELSDHRREVSLLRKTVIPEREIINRLSRGEAPFISSKMLFYFRDVYDHMFKFYLSLDAHRELISSTFETYTSVQSNKVGQTNKQLTVIATIFLPLTFITGVYGMNFANMPELQHPYGYFAILGVMAVIGFFMWTFFKKKNY